MAELRDWKEVPRPPVMALFPYDMTTSGATSPCLVLNLDAVSQSVKVSEEKYQLRLDQAWFWTPQWQAMEREADEDLAAGRYEEFGSLDDFIDGLRQLIDE